MIIGHFGVALAARSTFRKPLHSLLLLALLAASIAPDGVDVIYAISSFCNPYGLYSHTLHAVVLLAAAVGGAAYLATGSRSMAGLFLLVVMLHMPADFLTGRKLFAPGSELYGLRLYETPWMDWVVEVSLLIVGWVLARRRGGTPAWAVSVWTLIAAILLQTGFDIRASSDAPDLKPNACERAWSP